MYSLKIFSGQMPTLSFRRGELSTSPDGKKLHEDKTQEPALSIYVTFMAPPARMFRIAMFSFMLYLYRQAQAVLYLVSVTVFIHFLGISLRVLLVISCSSS